MHSFLKNAALIRGLACIGACADRLHLLGGEIDPAVRAGPYGHRRCSREARELFVHAAELRVRDAHEVNGCGVPWEAEQHGEAVQLAAFLGGLPATRLRIGPLASGLHSLIGLVL